MEVEVEKLLLRVHKSSGSTITANSRRMRTLAHDEEALAQCCTDVKKDIETYAHVSVETKARCVDAFAKRADVRMHVCGACGIRDLSDTYCKESQDPTKWREAVFNNGVVLDTGPVDRNEVVLDHWLQVGQDAYTRLKACPDMEMLRPGPNGVGYETVRVPRTDLHSLTEIGGRAYHVVPEAVLHDEVSNTYKVDLCKRCGRRWDAQLKAKRASSCQDATKDDFEDLYATNAPLSSIAHGEDFGRLSELRSKGIRVDVSTLERLLLAETRCHQIVYKVVAYGEQTDRKRLHGHSIVCPQKATAIEHNCFGKAALEAAYAAVRIVFVGPSGMQEKLERAALKIDDLRLRPDVIYNFLMLNHLLHDGPPVPSIEDIIELIEEHSLAAHVERHASFMHDTSIEEKTAPSDIANVRSHAQTEEDCLNEDPEGDTAVTQGHDFPHEDPEGDIAVAEVQDLEPSMVPIGLFELEPQQMDAVIKGIHRLVTEGEGGNAEDNPQNDNREGGNAENNSQDDNPDPETNARSIHLQREDRILSDYQSVANIIYKTWWCLMPLRRGFVKGKSIPDAKWRQLFLYFDNRFAHDHALLFHVANMMMRHAVNRAVNAKVKTSADAFQAFADIIHKGDFLTLLESARENPKGPEAREVVTRVIGFINLSAKSVPWSSRERAAELSKLIADHRYAGPSSIFLSVAPDDVHNPTGIRWSMPYTGPDKFPAIASAEFLTALRWQTAVERTTYAADGSVSFAMDESSLQLLASKNPVACALVFNDLIENVRGNLIGLSSERLKDQPIDERPQGTPWRPNHNPPSKPNTKPDRRYVWRSHLLSGCEGVQ